MSTTFNIQVGDIVDDVIRTPLPGFHTYGATVSLTDDSGAQVAFNIGYSVDKSTGGDDTGLLVNKLDLNSPGTSLLVDGQVASSSVFSVDDTGKVNCTDIVVSDKLAFAGTTALFGPETGDYTLTRSTTSTGVLRFEAGGTGATAASIELYSSIHPTRAGDIEFGSLTGLFDPLTYDASAATWYFSNNSIQQTGGMITIDRETADTGFFDLEATADADATSAISTLTTSGATTGHIQILINGVTAWIAISTTDPS